MERSNPVSHCCHVSVLNDLQRRKWEVRNGRSIYIHIHPIKISRSSLPYFILVKSIVLMARLSRGGSSVKILFRFLLTRSKSLENLAPVTFYRIEKALQIAQIWCRAFGTQIIKQKICRKQILIFCLFLEF